MSHEQPLGASHGIYRSGVNQMAKLLLAEDEEFSRDLMSRRLQRSGHEVIAVTNGREAVVAATQHRPDLILMDLDMPVMDGRHAIRLLKNDVRTFRIPIIVLTAYAETDDVAAALSAGCYSYEAKPVVFKHLLARIEAALELAGRRKPTPAAPSSEAGSLQ